MRGAEAALLPDLRRRRRQPELMDDPALEAGRHLRALDALRTVNLLSGTAGRVWREILSTEPRGRPLRVLDLACGGGDVAVAVKRRADAAGLPLEIHGCDRSEVALERARREAAARGAAVTFFQADVVSGPLPAGYDLLCSSLFLHHLPRPAAVAFLARMGAAAGAVFVQDLRRTAAGYALAFLTLHTVARSDVARVDGLRSVAGAFTLDEVEELARDAGLGGARLRGCWPQRFALSWRRA